MPFTPDIFDLPASDIQGKNAPLLGKSYNILYQMVAKKADLPWEKHYTKKHLHEFQGI